ncbi:glycosyltransferase family 9 protein [Pedobacter sp. JCM 36344]|uniref:glycosyltransferase family 9 protein n=1 Tax=Pedobacter sp. JCM 36344 TaxID=3374280 RepID=UPI0039784DB4
MAERAKILVIRFSAMGDVAMTVPVIKEFSAAYPLEELLVISRATFEPFFDGIPNLQFLSFEPKRKHKGFFGLIKLFFELKKCKVTKVADLHNNLRSKVLCLFFFFGGISTVSVDKGRSEKMRLTRKRNKELKPLKLTVSRYAEVFEKLSYPLTLTNNLSPVNNQKPGNEQWIGVSPFAQHLQKVYPVHKMERVLLELAKKGFKLFIFGGSSEEALVAVDWESKHQNITSLVKKMTLGEEMDFIAKLDLMLSMDSSGMHLASLKNVPVVSVWGATHPYVGFLGYGQSINDAVQLDLYCRPCSVYGNVPCYRGDFACMNNLPEQNVIDKVIDKLRDHETAIIS